MRFVPDSTRTKAILSAPFVFTQRFELGDVHVALEGKVARDLEPFVLHELLDRAAVQSDMRLRGREVIVHGRDFAGLYEGLRKDVLAGAALVRRQDQCMPNSSRSLASRRV